MAPTRMPDLLSFTRDLTARQWFVLTVIWATVFSDYPSARELDKSVSAATPQSEQQRRSMRAPGLPLVRATVAGRALWMIVDTGSDATFVHIPRNPQWPSSVSTPVGVNTPLGHLVMHYYRDVPVQAGNLPQRAIGVAVHPDFKVRELSESRIDGVLGLNYVGADAISMRLAEGYCELIPSAGELDGGVRVELRQCKRLLQADVDCGLARPQSATLDTGYRGLVALEKAVCLKLCEAGLAVPLDSSPIASAAKVTEANRYVAKRIRFAGQELRNVTVLEADRNLIGTRLLEEFEVILDFSRNVGWFRKASLTPPSPLTPDASGLTFRVQDYERYIVYSVDDKSPAQRAGIHVGDELLSLDGKQASVVGLRSIHDALKNDGSVVRLGLLRKDGRQDDVTLKLRWPIRYPPDWGPEWVVEAPSLPDP